MANPAGDESIQFQVMLDAAQAIAELGDLKSNAQNMDEVFDKIAAAMLEFSQKTGTSLAATASLFKRLIVAAEDLRAAMAGIPNLQSIIGQNPLFSTLAQIRNPFQAAIPNPVMEAQKANLTPQQLEEMQAAMQGIDAAATKVGLTLGEGFNTSLKRANELKSVMQASARDTDRIAAALGTSAESAAKIAPALASVGQLKFTIGAPDYQKNVEALSASMKAINAETGADVQKIGALLEKTFNIPHVAITDAIRAFNAELKLVPPTLEQIIAGLNGIKAASVEKSLAGIKSLDFTPLKNGANQAKAYADNVNALMGNIKNISTTTSASVQDVGKYIQQNFQNVPKVAITDAMKGLDNQIKGVKNSFEQAGQSAKGFNQVLHLIRGTLVAIGVFQVIQFITDSLQKATEAAKEFETSLYRIQNVERILSQSGVQTSVEGLLGIVRQLKKEMPIFSEADLTQQVSLIGIMTKEFGLTEKQIHDVAAAIGVLNVRSGEAEDLLTTTNKVLTAMVAPSGRGIASLGLDFSEAAIQAMALKTHVLQAGEAFTKLTDHQKDMIKIGILLQSTGEEFKTIQEFIKTNTGALAEQAAQWEDTLRNIGQEWIALKASAAPVIILILKFFDGAINGGKALQAIMIGLRQAFVGYAAAFVEITKNPGKFLGDPQKIKDLFSTNISEGFTQGLQEGFNKLFSGVLPAEAPEWMHTLFDQFAKLDTPTGEVNNLTSAFEKLGEAMKNAKVDDLIKDLEKLREKMRELQEEFDIKMAREQEDFFTDQKRAWEDYQRSVAQTVQDYADKRADAEARYRLQEEEAEARFQENMRQLRTKFLFDLEDALRSRDARQILRLIKQYQMEKENLTKEEELRKTFAAKQHAEEMARLRREEAERLAQLAEEYRIKQERAVQDYNTKKQREIEDHARDMADLQKQIDDRLKEFATAVADELVLREGGADAIYQALKNYYGEGGLFDGLYDYSIASMTAKSQQLLEMLQALANQFQQTTANTGGYTPGDQWWNDVGGQARGGTYLATSPTRATFGERGPELATFVPLKGAGSTKLPANAGGLLGGTGGNLVVRLQLSSGLEAEIVSKSLDGVSAVLEQVERSRR